MSVRKTFTTTELLENFSEKPTTPEAQIEYLALAPIQNAISELENNNIKVDPEIVLFKYQYDQNMNFDFINTEVMSVDDTDFNMLKVVLIYTDKEEFDDEELAQLDDLMDKVAPLRYFPYIEDPDINNILALMYIGNYPTMAIYDKIVQTIDDKLDELNDQDQDEEPEDVIYKYYVTYRDNITQLDKSMVIGSSIIIESEEDINLLIKKIASAENAATSEIFLYAFSPMGVKITEKEDKKETLESKVGDMSTSYMYSIFYKQNGEQKEHQCMINLDLNSYPDQKEELALSILEDVTNEDDEVELLDIVKLGEGSGE